jgi:hypothetical protein
VRAADVRALYDLLDAEELRSVEAFREELRRIIAPDRPAIAPAQEDAYVPDLD